MVLGHVMVVIVMTVLNTFDPALCLGDGQGSETVYGGSAEDEGCC